MAVAVDMAVAVAAEAAADAAVPQVLSAALEVPLASVAGAAVSVPALQVSVAGAAVSVYTADAHFLDGASVAVAAEAGGAEAGAAELAGYGHPRGAGSTLAGLSLHLRVKNLASRRRQSHR
jgi:hypothetical protein